MSFSFEKEGLCIEIMVSGFKRMSASLPSPQIPNNRCFHSISLLCNLNKCDEKKLLEIFFSFTISCSEMSQQWGRKQTKVKLLLQNQFMTNSKTMIFPFKEKKMKITYLQRSVGESPFKKQKFQGVL